MVVNDFTLTPVAGSAFERIVAETDWQEGAALPSRLCVARELGWLATVGENDAIDGIIGFSVENIRNTDVLLSSEQHRRGKNTSGTPHGRLV
jgi:hypothetical protein